jgi:hypothetical protein
METGKWTAIGIANRTGSGRSVPWGNIDSGGGKTKQREGTREESGWAGERGVEWEAGGKAGGHPGQHRVGLLGFSQTVLWLD